MKTEVRFWPPYLFFIAAVLICLVVLGASGWSLHTSSNKKISVQHGDGLKIGQNRTQHLQVVSVEQTDSEVLVMLKNGYSKSINALSISIGDLTITNDYIYSGKGIAPDSQYTFRIPKQPTSPSQYQRPDINILAVIFDDRTGDGENRYISKILDSRLGEKIQMRRILPLLQNMLKSSDDNLPNALDELTSQIATLPEFSDSQLSSDTQDASRSRKEFVLKSIQAIKDTQSSNNRASLRKHLAELKKQYEALIARL